MTFAALRALHAIIGDALDDVERIYRDASHDSPTPTTPYTVLAGISPSTPFVRRGSRDEDALAGLLPDEDLSASVARTPKTPLHRRNREGSGGIPFPRSNPSTDAVSREATHQLYFPGLDVAYYPTESHDPDADAAESLASHPDVIAATNRIVAACGQISATVHRPFLTLCDAAMGYNLPACLRFLEESHTVEILRSAGPRGMHVRELSQHVSVDEGKLSHVLRLLATHHITREVRPNVFANNRISAIMDSGKPLEELQRTPQEKYEATNGIAAFINLCTDELFKSSAFLADCYLPSRFGKAADDVPPMHAPFNLAFDTKIPYFEWLERPGNEMRLKRFGPAMTGTAAWEIPGAVLVAFPWHDLPDGSLVVDVGGGIGSTSMLLAHAFQHLKFVIQDRPQVVEQGVAAWKERCPEMLDSGRATFLGHDFFFPQPPLVPPGPGSTTTTAADPVTPAVYILRVVTHDWPDSFATKILLNLRRAAGPHTKLLIADHILPHACVDDHEDLDVNGEPLKLPGMVRSFAPEGSPLLPNLGKANANAYWLDLTMRVAFNAQERTLREMAALLSSAGWKIVDVVHGEDSLFGHITAVPTEIPEASLKLLDSPQAEPTQATAGNRARSASTKSVPESVRMNNTFGTHTALPTEEAIRKPARVRKARRSLLPWLKNKPAPEPKTASSSQQVTPENQPDASSTGGKPPKAHSRKPRLSMLTSPSSSSSSSGQDRSAKPQHTRTGSVVRILSQASKSVVSLTLHDPGSSAVRFRDDQSIPLPGASHSRSPRSRSGGGGHHEDVPPVPPLLPALEVAGHRERAKPMPSRTSLRKKASQVFGLGRASMANLRAAALGGDKDRDKDKERGMTGVGGLGLGSPVQSVPSGMGSDRERTPPEGKEGRGGKVAGGGGRARSESKAQLGGSYVTVEMRPRGDGSVEPGWSGE